MSNLLRLPAAHLAVIGMALVTLSLRPGPAGAAAAVPHVAPPRVHVVAHRATPPAPSGPTSWAALNTAIARIPTYHAGTSRWIVSGRYGHWGTTDWYHDTLYISPAVPGDRLYDVAVHEWSHELSVLDYRGDVDAAVKAMTRYFGGSGLIGAGSAAHRMGPPPGGGAGRQTA